MVLKKKRGAAHLHSTPSKDHVIWFRSYQAKLGLRTQLLAVAVALLHRGWL